MNIEHRIIVRSENFLVFLASITLFTELNFSWKVFFILILVPDFAFLGYMAGKRVGYFLYNLVHTYIAPFLLSLFYELNSQVLVIALIWVIHISFDRSLGYGLKFPGEFKKNHLSCD